MCDLEVKLPNYKSKNILILSSSFRLVLFFPSQSWAFLLYQSCSSEGTVLWDLLKCYCRGLAQTQQLESVRSVRCWAWPSSLRHILLPLWGIVFDDKSKWFNKEDWKKSSGRKHLGYFWTMCCLGKKVNWFRKHQEASLIRFSVCFVLVWYWLYFVFSLLRNKKSKMDMVS